MIINFNENGLLSAGDYQLTLAELRRCLLVRGAKRDLSPSWDVQWREKLIDNFEILDPYKIWTWDRSSRIPAPNSPKKQLPMWHRYRVELYPHYGQLSGITDKYGHELLFPSAFRQSRVEHRPKGIIQLIKK